MELPTNHMGAEKVRMEKPSKKKKLNLGDLVSERKLLAYILLVQVVGFAILGFFVANPPYLMYFNRSQQILDEVSKLTEINLLDNPVILQINDVNKLRNENEIQKAIYKDAAEGDYAIAFSDGKMVIFRRSENKLVYQGDSPKTLLEKSTQQLTAKIIDKAKAAALLASSDQNLNPQLFKIDDLDTLRSQNPTFYKDAQKGDIVALFPTKGVVLLYREATDKVVTSGKFNTSIVPSK